MGITVANQPPATAVGPVAYNTGVGFYDQTQQQRADRDRLANNQIAANIYQTQLGVAGDAWRQQNQLGAERERMVIGAQLESLRTAGNQAFEYQMSQNRLAQQKELYSYQIGQQQEAEQREYTLKQQRQIAEIDNAVGHVNSELGAGRYSQQQADYLLEQLGAKRAGVQPMPRVPEKPALPGDWQPGVIRDIGGSKWYMTPEGRPLNLGGMDDPEQAQADVNARSVIYVDPVTGDRHPAFIDAQGNLTFPSTELAESQQRSDAIKRQLEERERAGEIVYKPPTASEIANLYKVATDMLTTTEIDEVTELPRTVPPSPEAVAEQVDRMIEQSRRQVEQYNEQLRQRRQQQGQEQQQPAGPPPTPGATAEAANLDAATAQGVAQIRSAYEAAGVPWTPELEQAAADRIRTQARTKAPPMQPPGGQSQAPQPTGVAKQVQSILPEGEPWIAEMVTQELVRRGDEYVKQRKPVEAAAEAVLRRTLPKAQEAYAVVMPEERDQLTHGQPIGPIPHPETGEPWLWQWHAGARVVVPVRKWKGDAGPEKWQNERRGKVEPRKPLPNINVK